MKKIVLALSLACSALIAQAGTPVINALVEVVAATFKWEKTEIDFGKIPQNKPVTATFSFSNNGDEPIIITDVRTSCGCTAPEWPKEPIMPGEKAYIKAVYNAASIGIFNKTITVVSNTSEGQTILKIKGEVVQ